MNGLYVVECLKCHRIDFFNEEPEFGVDFDECKCGRRSFRGSYTNVPKGCMKVWNECKVN